MGLIRKTRLAVLGLLFFGLTSFSYSADAVSAPLFDSDSPVAQLNIPAARARMAPELALKTHEENYQHQRDNLGEYRDTTVIEAELPKTAQKGIYRLQRFWSAPRSVAFKAIDFAGDGFIKTQVIARLLQSEVDHTKNEDTRGTAIIGANYKFSYKGVSDIDGDPVHVFAVKPRQKRPGLFKGKIYLDVYTGTIRRSEGTMVKSPSFFVKNIQFVQDYQQVDGFSFVTRIHSTADTKIVGKTIVDITHADYLPRSVAQLVTPSQSTVRSASLTGSDR